MYRKALKKLEDFQDKRVEMEMWMMKTWNRNIGCLFVGEVPSFRVEYVYFRSLWLLLVFLFAITIVLGVVLAVPNTQRILVIKKTVQ